MPKINKLLSSLLVALVLLGVTTPAALASDNKTTLLVSAAASTTDALNQIIKNFEAANPTVDVVPNYGSSGALAKQIIEGGRADIFLSAAAKDMDTVEQAKMSLAATRVNLLGNRLVVIVPKDPKSKNVSNLRIVNLKDLSNTRIKTIALGEPASVPAGRYAMEAVKYYQVDSVVKKKAIYGKDVRQVLQYVASGNVDCGFVYQTDAFISKSVGIAYYVPTASHTKITYPVAILSRGQARTEAEAFLAYLQTESSKKIFRRYGFLTY